MVASEGGRPNLPTKTLGGTQLWADVWYRHDFRIQEHAIAGHHRLLDPHDVRRAWGSFEHCKAVLERIEVRPHEDPEHLVLLLHGLGRTRSSMMKLSRALRAEGLATASLSYASTRRPIEEHAAAVASVLSGLSGTRRVSFVTHSLGGIVVRYVLARAGAWRERIEPHRMVMLAPPNQGSEVARRLPRTLLEVVLGRSAIEIADGRCRELGPPPIPCGVIAGSLRAGRGIHGLVAGGDDGLVAVAETRLDDISDHRTVAALHTFIMNHPEVPAAVARFLTADVPRFH